jgi:hypothetical protein
LQLQTTRIGNERESYMEVQDSDVHSEMMSFVNPAIKQ